MEKTRYIKSKANMAESIEEFVMERGWYVPSIHEKYITRNKTENPRD